MDRGNSGIRAALGSVALVVVVAACSGGGGAGPTAPLVQASAPPATATVSAPPPTPAPSGPATATLTFVGDVHLAAGIGPVTIRCNFPNLNGSNITVFGSSKDGVDSFFLTVTGAVFYLRVSAGSGTTFTYRQFQGSGVTAFDSARGAQLSGAVSETTPTGAATGAIPVIASMTATIDCGGQTAGSGTVHVKGTLPAGAVDADLTDLRVECDTFQGNMSVVGDGLVMIGTKQSFVAITVQPTGATTLFFSIGPVPAYLNGPAPSSGKITGQSATFDADASAPASATSPAIIVHMSGQVTCGSSVGN
jgi:hypothetical protein